MMWREKPFAHLRPTTIPETLDRSLDVTFRLGPLLFLASFIYASNYLVSIASYYIPGFHTSTPIIAAGLLLLMLLREFVAAISFLAVFQGMLFPLRPLSGKALLRTALRKLPAYFFTQILYMIAVVFFAIISWGFLTSQTPTMSHSIQSAFALATLFIGLWVTIRLSLAPVVCLIEETSPWQAFKRSHYLTSTFKVAPGGRRDSPVTRYILITLFPLSIVTVLAAGFILYGTAIGMSWPVQLDDPQVKLMLGYFGFIASFAALPFYRSGLMALYIEYRMRHEALDFYLRLRERRREDSGNAERPFE